MCTDKAGPTHQGLISMDASAVKAHAEEVQTSEILISLQDFPNKKSLDRQTKKTPKIKPRVANIYQNNKFLRHSQHSARHHFASKCCNSLKCDWLLTGNISLRLSSTAFLDDNLWMPLLNYPSYGLKHMSLPESSV